MLYHGHSILEHQYSEDIRKIHTIRYDLGIPKVGRVRDYVLDMKTALDKLEKPRSREIRMTESLMSSLRTMTSSLSIEQSSLIRLCLYFSLNTMPSVFGEVNNTATRLIQKFDKYIIETEAIYTGFALIERLVQEGEQEHTKAEIKAYPVQECAIAEKRRIWKKVGT